MTLGVFIIVVLPGQSVLGVWAAIGLIIARIIQGISAGGEFGSATAFLTENAKHGKAYYASFQTATQGISMFRRRRHLLDLQLGAERRGAPLLGLACGIRDRSAHRACRLVHPLEDGRHS